MACDSCLGDIQYKRDANGIFIKRKEFEYIVCCIEGKLNDFDDTNTNHVIIDGQTISFQRKITAARYITTELETQITVSILPEDHGKVFLLDADYPNSNIVVEFSAITQQMIDNGFFVDVSVKGDNTSSIDFKYLNNLEDFDKLSASTFSATALGFDDTSKLDDSTRIFRFAALVAADTPDLVWTPLFKEIPYDDLDFENSNTNNVIDNNNVISLQRKVFTNYVATDASNVGQTVLLEIEEEDHGKTYILNAFANTNLNVDFPSISQAMIDNGYFIDLTIKGDVDSNIGIKFLNDLEDYDRLSSVVPNTIRSLEYDNSNDIGLYTRVIRLAVVEKNNTFVWVPIFKEIPNNVLKGNSVFVSDVYGNDITGERERLDLPFKTIGAANNAAQSGDTVYVEPAIYDMEPSEILLKPEVNLYLEAGAKVYHSDITTSVFSFGAYEDPFLLAPNNYTHGIFGNGDLYLQQSTSNPNVFVTNTANYGQNNYSSQNYIIELNSFTTAGLNLNVSCFKSLSVRIKNQSSEKAIQNWINSKVFTLTKDPNINSLFDEEPVYIDFEIDKLDCTTGYLTMFTIPNVSANISLKGNVDVDAGTAMFLLLDLQKGNVNIETEGKVSGPGKYIDSFYNKVVAKYSHIGRMAAEKIYNPSLYNAYPTVFKFASVVDFNLKGELGPEDTDITGTGDESTFINFSSEKLNATWDLDIYRRVKSSPGWIGERIGYFNIDQGDNSKNVIKGKIIVPENRDAQFRIDNFGSTHGFPLAVFFSTDSEKEKAMLVDLLVMQNQGDTFGQFPIFANCVAGNPDKMRYKNLCINGTVLEYNNYDYAFPPSTGTTGASNGSLAFHKLNELPNPAIAPVQDDEL